MFEYKIPQEIKISLTKEFAVDFLNKLIVIFNLKQTTLCLEYLFNLESTCGWADAFKYTCQKHNMEDVLAHYNKLEWYDSDLFDDEFASLIVEYGLVKE